MRSSPLDCAGLLGRFQLEGTLASCAAETRGHINDTFIAAFQHGPSRRRYVVQRLNSNVFKDPRAVMGNLAAVTRTLRERLRDSGATNVHRRTLTLVPTRDGGDFTVDDRGELWRAFVLIEGSRTHPAVSHPRQAYQAGRAFGAFQAQLMNYAGPRLAEVLPGFHDTRARFQALRAAVADSSRERLVRCDREVEALLRRESLASLLLDLREQGSLPERIAHNDAKIGNLLFDDATGEALCVIDLDTVMPGLAPHDFGDLVRSSVCRAAEDEGDLHRVDLEPDLFEALTSGYLETAGAFLCAAEKEALVLSSKIIVYEQALRFLTDHLEGDRYYRVARPGHNLDRSRVQIRLLERIEEREPELDRCVERLAAGSSA